MSVKKISFVSYYEADFNIETRAIRGGIEVTTVVTTITRNFGDKATTPLLPHENHGVDVTSLGVEFTHTLSALFIHEPDTSSTEKGPVEGVKVSTSRNFLNFRGKAPCCDESEVTVKSVT